MPHVVCVAGETLSQKLRIDLAIHMQEIGLKRVAKNKKYY